MQIFWKKIAKSDFLYMKQEEIDRFKDLKPASSNIMSLINVLPWVSELVYESFYIKGEKQNSLLHFTLKVIRPSKK